MENGLLDYYHWLNKKAQVSVGHGISGFLDMECPGALEADACEPMYQCQIKLGPDMPCQI